MSDWEAIVLDLDGGDRLIRCLESLERQTDRPARVILVDNGSLVPASRRAGERSIDIRFIRMEENAGFTGGVNRAWREVSAPWIALVNNDVELDADWAGSILDEMAGSELTGSGQAIIATMDGRIDGAGIDVSSGRFLQLAHDEPLESDPGKPWGASATAAIFRKRALEEVSLGPNILHPRFFAYYEDVELAARMRSGGWKTILVPRPLARHEGSATAGRLASRSEYLRTRNRYFVTRLHPGVGSRPVLLAEDLRRFLRALGRLRPRSAARIVAGVVSGVVSQV